MDIDFFLEKILDIAKQYYPDAVADKVLIKKNKLFIYGRIDDKWFKIIINKQKGDVRVYSPSKTIEHVLKRRLEKYVQNKRYI
jgi:hypothetical protein